jgi:hypothetical protein
MATRNQANALQSTQASWEIAENATMRLPRRETSSVVRVERGTVLVTQEGDLEDHLLAAGDEVVLDGGGLAVAWAFTDASVTVRNSASPATLRRPGRRVALRVRAPATTIVGVM